MSLNDNSTVSIVINVVDNNSAQVLSSTQARLQGVGTSAQQAGVLVDQFGRSFEQAGASAAALTAQLGAVGTTAAAAGAEGAAGMDRLSGSIQGVRLAGQEMGLHVPRAMYSIIAANQTLMAGVQALFGLFVVIGAVAIFEQMANGVVNLYDKWFNVTKAVEDYQQKTQQAAEQKLFDTASLETATTLLGQVNKEIDQLNAKKSAAGASGLSMLGGIGATGFEYTSQAAADTAVPGFTPADDQKLAQSMKNRDALQARQSEQQEQFDKERMQNQAAYDAASTKGYDQINAKLKDSVDLAMQQYAITQAHEDLLAKQASAAGKTYTPDPHAGDQQFQLAWEKAQQEASAARISMYRTETEEVIQMQNAAVDAGLQGQALLDAKEEQAIDAVWRKHQQGELSKQAMMAETAAIAERFSNEQMLRLDQQERETEKIEREVQQAGLTGIAKLQAEGANKVDDIGADPNLDPAQKARRQAAAKQSTNNQIEEQQRTFNQRLQEMDDQTDDAMLQGYARIDAETRKHVDELEKLFQEYYGQLAAGDPKRVAAEQAVQQEIVNIDTQAERERQQLHQRTMEQIAQVEAQAARATLAPWQAAQQDILDQFNQRVQKETDLINQNAISWDEYCKAIEADYRLSMAQMEKSAEQTRDQLASQLSSLFSDPAGYMKKRAEDLMFQILANWLMQMMKFNQTAGSTLGWLFGMGAPTSTSTNPGTLLGGIFGTHGSSHGAMSESLGLPQGMAGLTSAGPALTSAGSTLSAAGSTLSSSGTMLSTSATSLDSAATALSSAASQVASMSASGGSGGGGGIGGLLGGLTGDSGGGDFGAAGLPDWSGLDVGSSATPSLDPLGSLGQGDITSGAGTIGNVSDVPPGSLAGGSSGWGAAEATGASSLGMIGGEAVAALGGTLAMVNAWKTNNTGAAVLSGAMTGAGIGTMILPGIGTAIGAIGGALVGWIGSLFGDHGTGKAKKYDQQTVQPALTKELYEFEAGQLGYTQATKDLQDLQSQAYTDVWGLGSGARKYYTNTIAPEIAAAETQLLQSMKGGRDQVNFSAAQFHDGGTIGHFGSLWTSPTTGFIHAKLGETVMNPAASSSFAPVLAMMNSGLASRTARMPASNGGGEVHYHINALDAKSFKDFLQTGNNSMALRSAINQSLSRYGGSSDN